jgi:hypothetical protein
MMHQTPMESCSHSSGAQREKHDGSRLLPRLGDLAAHVRVKANMLAVPALATVLMQGIVL